MGSYLSFYAEQHSEAGWSSVTGIGKYHSVEWLYYAKNFWSLFDLFRPETGALPVRRGFPESMSQLLTEKFGQDSHENYVWVPVDELMFEDWSRERVQVHGSVPARYCSLFRDGCQPFPLEELQAAGMKDVWSHVRPRVSVNQPPIDYTGKLAYVTFHTHPDHAVPATWTETLEELVGTEFMTQVADRLLSLQCPDKLRLIGQFD